MAKLPDSRLITDFDPCAPSILGDRKYSGNADSDFLKSEAKRIHQTRLLCMIRRLSTPSIKLAVARDFCFKRQWITDAMYLALYYELYPAKAPKASSPPMEGDDVMDDVTSAQESASQPVASPLSVSPADGASAPVVL